MTSLAKKQRASAKSTKILNILKKPKSPRNPTKGQKGRRAKRQKVLQKKNSPFAIRHSPFVIRGDMRIAEVVALIPSAERLMAEYGLHCANCSLGGVDTLGAGARSHGFTDADVAQLIADLNELLRDMPQKPMTIIVTLSAARSLEAILIQEGQPDSVLSVETDTRGNFCMEFRASPAKDDLVFYHPEAKNVRVVASKTTLWKVGGATIDFRDGRFKLDLPSTVPAPRSSLETSGGGCECGGACNCA